MTPDPRDPIATALQIPPEARAARAVSLLETVVPCPFVVLVSFAFDHALAAGTSESMYLWLGGSICLSERGVTACKIS